MAFFNSILESMSNGEEGAGPSFGVGAGRATPGLTYTGFGDLSDSEGRSIKAFFRQIDANSKVGTGTAYD